MLSANNNSASFEPICCQCMKSPDAIKPMVVPNTNDVLAYWFLFEELNLPTVANSQNIDDILKAATNEFPIVDGVKSEVAPDYDDEEKSKKKKKIKIRYKADPRKTFDYNFEYNLLCPSCATEFISSKFTDDASQEGHEETDF